MTEAPAIKYAVIDTEGSGLFDYSKPADAPGQPRLAALAMILLKPDLTVEEEWLEYVKPDGWVISPEITAINGLTTEFLMERGKPVAEVLRVYAQVIKEGYTIVAFNAQHDTKTMRAEFRLAGLDDLFEQTKNICVMRASNGHILKRGGKKGWPKLEEAREALGLNNGKAHTAASDCRDARDVLLHLRSLGVEMEGTVHYAKNRPEGAEERRPPDGDAGASQAPDAPVSRPRGAVPAEAAPLLPLADQDIPQ